MSGALMGRLDIVRKVLRHFVINLTMRYLHPNEEDERAVVETLIKNVPRLSQQVFGHSTSEVMRYSSNQIIDKFNEKPT